MLQRAVELVPLRRPQLVEVGVDPLARLRAAFAVAAAQILDDFLTRENRLGDLVEHVIWFATIASNRPPPRTSAHDKLLRTADWLPRTADCGLPTAD